MNGINIVWEGKKKEKNFLDRRERERERERENRREFERMSLFLNFTSINDYIWPKTM